MEEIIQSNASSEIPIKRRGRPKGSKNPPQPSPSIDTDKQPIIDKPVPGINPVVRKSKTKVPINPEWVMSKTSFGTSVAIIGIITRGNSYEFMVIPRAEEGCTSKTTVRSTEVYRPVFSSPEQEKEFDGIKFWEDRVVPVVSQEQEAQIIPVEVQQQVKDCHDSR